MRPDLELDASADGGDLAQAGLGTSPQGVRRTPTLTRCRPPSGNDGRPGRKPMMLNLSGSLSSLKTSLAGTAPFRPETPLPNRESFRSIMGRVDVIIFDFDGTLTATPGDRQVRSQKSVELCERAELLRPRLQALREAGCALGIMSKSTKATVLDALAAGGLAGFFDAPVVGKAVGFEGKAGFIMDLVRSGSLRRPGDRRRGPPCHRILLVDDDVLELERAAARGIQTYAAPGDGGLRAEDFDTIEASLKLPPTRPPACLLPSEGARTLSGSQTGSMLGCTKPSGRWRNLILFSGQCIEG